MEAKASPALSPFTGSPAREVWGRREGRNIYTCPDTGAVFFDRRDLASEDYQTYYPYLKDFDERRFAWEIGIRREKFRWQLARMARLAPGRRLVDVGAGPGYLCKVASEEGWMATGVEVSADARLHGERYFGVEYRTLAEIPDGTVDAITCHHVLEHIYEPVAFLALLRAKLKPRGLLVLHVPHRQPLTYRLRSARGGKTMCSLYGTEHVSGFTPDALRRFLERNGFATHFVRTAGMWSRYYDPFFARNLIEKRDWLGLAKKAVRHAVDLIGVPFGAGDWVVGYFRKAESAVGRQPIAVGDHLTGGGGEAPRVS